MKPADNLKHLLLVIIFLLPLLSAQGKFGYEQIKVLFFLASVSLAAVFWMGKTAQWTLISKAAALFILTLLITSLTGLDPKISLLGQPPYFQGWILYLYFFLFYLIVKSLKVQLTVYARVLSVSSLVVSFLAVKDFILLNILNIPVSNYSGRVVSTFGQPNFYAGFLLFSLPLNYILFKSSAKKLQYLGWGSGLAALAGILVSYSRSAILLALILLSLGLVSELKFKLKIGLAVLGIIAILTAVNFSAGTYGIVWKEVVQPVVNNNPDLTTQSVEKRAYVWPVIFKLVSQQPFLGYGLENISLAYADYFENNKHLLFEENLAISPLLISLKELNVDRSHNFTLDLLLFAGIFGLITWLGLVSLMFIKLKYHGRIRNVLLVSVLVLLVWTQLQNQSIVHLVYFWLLLGIIDQ